MDIKELGNQIVEGASENKSTILTVGAVIGVGVTLIATSIATVKAKKVIDDNNGIITKEVVGDIVKISIPVVLATGMTITCIILAHREDMAKNAALAAIVAADSKKLEALSKKAEKQLGIEKPAEKDDKNDNPTVSNLQVANVDKTETLVFVDEFTGQKFESTYDKILKAVGVINAYLQAGEDAPAADFYEILGVETGMVVNNDYYWGCEDGPLEPDFGAELNDNFEVYRTLAFNRDPVHVERRLFD